MAPPRQRSPLRPRAVAAMTAALDALAPRTLTRCFWWLVLLLAGRWLTAERLERWWRRRLLSPVEKLAWDAHSRFAHRFFERVLASGSFARLAARAARGGRWQLASQIEAFLRIVFFTELRRPLLRSRGAPPPLMEVQLATCSECDLGCAGCYASGDRGGRAPDAERMAWLVDEAARAGACAVHLLGKGEPFLDERRSLELIRLAARRPWLLFTIATNGTHLGPALADALAAAPNVLCLVSVDGLQPANDARRGAGTFARALAAMRLLRERGAAFGFSCTVTADNWADASSRAFVAAMREAGCCLGVYTRFFAVAPAADGRLALRGPALERFAEARDAVCAGAGMPILDLDELEESTGCRARAGLSVYVDGTTGQVSPCIKVPLAPASCRLEGAAPGELSRVLGTPFFQDYRGGRCTGGHWCGADLACEQRAVETAQRAHETACRQP